MCNALDLGGQQVVLAAPRSRSPSPQRPLKVRLQKPRSRLEALSEWERRVIVQPLQKLRQLDLISTLLGWSVMGESLLVLFACLYWALDQYKCVAGIWLVPISEVANGCIKWLTRRPRPL